jgi:hypothetical protein
VAPTDHHLSHLQKTSEGPIFEFLKKQLPVQAIWGSGIIIIINNKIK